VFDKKGAAAHPKKEMFVLKLLDLQYPAIKKVVVLVFIFI
jgi:hypothetical protein